MVSGGRSQIEGELWGKNITKLYFVAARQQTRLSLGTPYINYCLGVYLIAPRSGCLVVSPLTMSITLIGTNR